MKQIHVLLADKDAGYMDALVEFLMAGSDRILVHAYTDPELFAEDAILLEENEYDIAVAGAEFLRILKENKQLEEFQKKVPAVMQLLSLDDEITYVKETVPKYQAMDGFLQQLERHYYAPKNVVKEDRGGMEAAYRSEKVTASLAENSCRKNYTAVYSPAHHELMLPAALLYAEQQSQQEPVIVVDMEENSRLYELIGRRNTYSLTDYLYLRKHNDITLDEVLVHEENVYFLPVVSCPMELGSISADQWHILISDLLERKEAVVFVFDSLHQGSADLLDLCSRLLVIERKEQVYRHMQQENCRMLSKWKPHIRIFEVGLGLTVGSDSSASWNMDDLRNSNLAEFIRTKSAEWEALQ